MTTETKIIEEYTDKTVDTDIDNQQRAQREEELSRWSEEDAIKLAADEGVELSPAHLDVIYHLRDHYLEHGQAENARSLSEMLDQAFTRRGGLKYLYQIFPDGPVTQGMRLAGLPSPASSEDEGFGTAY